HALYEWPSVLGPVAWGGEMLQNLLLAYASAAAVECYRSWRQGRPAWRQAWIRFSIPVVVWASLCVVDPPAPVVGPAAAVDVVAFEPGREESKRLMYSRDSYAMANATLAIAGRGAADPPDLVVWPETAVDPLWFARGSPLQLAASTRFAGGSLLRDGEFDYSALVLFDPLGRVLGWNEKRHPVPAAERMPWLFAMPEWIRTWCEGIVGYVPRMGFGRPRPSLETAAGVPFGGMMCFDNAFDDVAREHVAAGARFLVVASNEIWYDQGAELDQMVAMSVFRALETATPLVRSTSDGRTVAVRASGEIVAPPLERVAGRAGIGFLRTDLQPGPGALGPLAWLHPLLDWLLPLSGVLLVGLIRRK
ncbi:MAG: hypothetical protein KDB80_00650, partial [Planctomycetes bacterium]|nr:hypothetical protein [Planctomycetota bacterium]